MPLMTAPSWLKPRPPIFNKPLGPEPLSQAAVGPSEATIKTWMQALQLRHIGVIMDGNRRWAKQKGLPTTMGHIKGVESFKKTSKLRVRLRAFRT